MHSSPGRMLDEVRGVLGWLAWLAADESPSQQGSACRGPYHDATTSRASAICSAIDDSQASVVKRVSDTISSTGIPPSPVGSGTHDAAAGRWARCQARRWRIQAHHHHRTEPAPRPADNRRHHRHPLPMRCGAEPATAQHRYACIGSRGRDRRGPDPVSVVCMMGSARLQICVAGVGIAVRSVPE